MERGDFAPAETLRAALNGDERAWALLVQNYEDLLWWIARSHRLEEGEAADLVQTVWLTLLRKGSSINDPDRLAGWLATTAKREAWARVRRRDRMALEQFDVPEDAAAGGEVSEQLLDEETLGEVLIAFRQLGERCQTLLRLVTAVPPISYEEIAARLGKSTGYVGPTRARCLDELRQIISDGTIGEQA